MKITAATILILMIFACLASIVNAKQMPHGLREGGKTPTFQRIKISDMKLSNGNISHPAYIYSIDKPYEPKYPGNMPFMDRKADLNGDNIKELILKGESQGNRGGYDEYSYYTFYKWRKENIYETIGSVIAAHVQILKHTTNGYRDIEISRSCYDKNKKVSPDEVGDMGAFMVAERHNLYYSDSDKGYAPTKEDASLDQNPCGRFH